MSNKFTTELKKFSALGIGGAKTVISGRAARALGRPIPPRLVSFELTARCNLHCKFCDVHRREDSRSAEDELSVEQIESVFSDRALSALEVVRLSGGEPTLRRDLPEIIRAIARTANPSIFYITTNGTYPERVERLLSETLPRGLNIHLQVSLDGEPKIHEKLRGAKGITKRVLQTLDIAGRYRREYPFYAGVNHAISPDTVDQMPYVTEQARKRGLGYKTTLISRHNENTSVEENPLVSEMTYSPRFEEDRKQLKELYTLFFSISDPGSDWSYDRNILSSRLWKLFERYLYVGQYNRLFLDRKKPDPPCMAAFSYFRLRPNGDVISCIPLNNPLGNLRQNSFSEIWHGERARQIRKDVKSCHGCWLECDRGPSAFYSGDIILQAPTLFLRRK
jgi:MoaA/NifB/PqqE/SkfB family radical SAM enzyme